MANGIGMTDYTGLMGDALSQRDIAQQIISESEKGIADTEAEKQKFEEQSFKSKQELTSYKRDLLKQEMETLDKTKLPDYEPLKVSTNAKFAAGILAAGALMLGSRSGARGAMTSLNAALQGMQAGYKDAANMHMQEYETKLKKTIDQSKLDLSKLHALMDDTNLTEQEFVDQYNYTSKSIQFKLGQFARTKADAVKQMGSLNKLIGDLEKAHLQSVSSRKSGTVTQGSVDDKAIRARMKSKNISYDAAYTEIMKEKKGKGGGGASRTTGTMPKTKEEAKAAGWKEGQNNVWLSPDGKTALQF